MAPMHGAKFVLPGERLDATNIAALIREEGVTFTCGVPTIWTTYLNHLEQTGAGPAKLARVLVGGSSLPHWMAARFAQYGVQTVQGWGLTETSPVGVAGTRTPQVDLMFGSDDTDYIRSRQGRLLFGVQLRIVDDDDKVLPSDGVATGHIQVRGPYVIQRYFNSDSSAANPQGWFDTGDIGTVDPQGYLRLTDRAKDLIKSGGEWISSIDIENRVSSYPWVRLAAVVGIPHPKWDERPLLIVDTDSPGPTAAQLIDHLRPHLAKWWLPDDVVFAPIPLTATGKIDKRTLRTTYRDRFAGPKCPPAPT
jgi:fatty-acyl-CoA synthase